MRVRLRWLIGLSVAYLRDASSAMATAWNRFWFAPADPTTLCLIRVLAGLMLFYTHAVWTLDLDAFFGASVIETRNQPVGGIFHQRNSEPNPPPNDKAVLEPRVLLGAGRTRSSANAALGSAARPAGNGSEPYNAS